MKNKLKFIRGNTLQSTIVVFCIVFSSISIYAQSPENTTDKPEVDLGISYYKNADNTRTVKVKLSRMVDRKRVYLQGEIVNLYLNDISKNGMLGNVMTDENGEGEFHLISQKFKKATDSLTSFNFIASFKNSEKYADKEAGLTVNDGSLDLQCYKKDSVKYIKATVSSMDPERNLVPASDIQVHFYVQRMFSLLPIGGDYTYTDESGEVTIEFPEDLPGDENGNVDIFAKVEDDESLGNITKEESENWGVPAATNVKFNQRALWSSRANAPVPLIIISTAIIVGVWTVILYLVIQLFQIRKLNRKEE